MMKYIFYVTLIIGGYIIPSCSDPTVEIENYTIKIDSISVPDTISTSDILNIHLYGTIGDNGCYSFYRYEATSGNNSLDLTAIGKHEKHEICTLLYPLLDDTYQVHSVQQGNFYIKINQPDGGALRDTVFVR